MTVLIRTPEEEAALIAAQAIQATREVLTHAVEEMMMQSHHVLLYTEGQEDLAHLAIQGVAKTIVDTMAPSNPLLDNIIVLDSTDEGWSAVAPSLEIMHADELQPSYLHTSQAIFAFGSEFLASRIVQPFAQRANRFYAAIPDGPQAEALIERVHPLREVVIL